MKVGKLGKFDKTEMLKRGEMFSQLAIPTEHMKEFEKMCKQYGGSYLKSSNSKGDMTYIGVPENQLPHIKRMLEMITAKTLDKNAVISDKTTEGLSDIINTDRTGFMAFLGKKEIPYTLIDNSDGTIVLSTEKINEKSLKSFIAEYRDIVKEADNIGVSLSNEVLSANEKKEIIDISPEQAEMMSEAFKDSDIKPQIFENDDKSLYAVVPVSIKDKTEEVLKKSADIIFDTKNIAVVGSGITISKEKLRTNEQFDTESQIFVKLPFAKDEYIYLDKSDCKEIDNGKTISSHIDIHKTYSVYNASGNEIESNISGLDILSKFSSRDKLKVPEGAVKEKMFNEGSRRIEIYDPEQNKYFRIGISSSDELRAVLQPHFGLKTEMILSNIDKQLVDADMKEIFAYSRKEPTYDVIENRNNELADVKFSGKYNKLDTGKMLENHSQSLNSDVYNCTIYDKSKNIYVEIPVTSERSEIENVISGMGYSPYTVSAVMNKIENVYDHQGLDVLKNEISSFDASIEDVKNRFPDADMNALNTGEKLEDIQLFNDGQYNALLTNDKYMMFASTSDVKDIETALTEKFGLSEQKAATVIDILEERNTISLPSDSRSNMNITPVTQNIVRIEKTDGFRAVPVFINRNEIVPDRLEKKLGIPKEEAKKLSKDLSKSFKARDRDRMQFLKDNINRTTFKSILKNVPDSVIHKLSKDKALTPERVK